MTVTLKGFLMVTLTGYLKAILTAIQTVMRSVCLLTGFPMENLKVNLMVNPKGFQMDLQTVFPHSVNLTGYQTDSLMDYRLG